MAEASSDNLNMRKIRRPGSELHRDRSQKNRAFSPPTALVPSLASKTKRRERLPLYKNPKAPVANRVRDLLSRMTLQEKAAQMMCVWQEKAQKLVDSTGNFDLAKAKAALWFQ